MGQDRPRTGGKALISRLVASIATGQGWAGKLSRARIWDVWEDVVGPQIALHAWPSTLKKGDILEIIVSDSVWMQQLGFQKHVILQALNRKLPRGAGLKDIRFVLGDIERARSSHKKIGSHVKKETLEIDSGLESEARKRFEKIQDKELREAMMHLYLKSLTRRKKVE